MPQGGAGTFSVVLEATSLVSPPVTLQAATVSFDGEDMTATRILWSTIVENGLRWAEQGWSAFITSNSALYVTPVLSDSVAKASIQPLLDLGVSSNNSSTTVEVTFNEFGSWEAFFNTYATADAAVGFL